MSDEQPGRGTLDAVAALRRISDSDLDGRTREVLSRFVGRFPDLEFAYEEAAWLDAFQEEVRATVPAWLRRLRHALAGPVHPAGRSLVELELPDRGVPAALLEGGWAISVLRGPSDRREGDLAARAGLLPIASGGPFDSQVLAVSTGGVDRSVYVYAAESVAEGDVPTGTRLLDDYLELFERAKAVEVVGQARFTALPDAESGPGMRFLADLAGRSVDEAAADPLGTLTGGLGALMTGLQQAAADEASGDPDRRRRSEAWGRGLAERLGAGSTDAAEQQVADAARQRFQTRLGDALSETVARLERLRDTHDASRQAADTEKPQDGPDTEN
jgi:hypothetical protein